MIKAFQLTFLTPLEQPVQEEVNRIRVPFDAGSIQILRHHAPIILHLEAGVVEYNLSSENGPAKRIGISGGILEVTKHSVKILADEVFFENEIPEDFILKYRDEPSFHIQADEFGTREQNIARYRLAFFDLTKKAEKK